MKKEHKTYMIAIVVVVVCAVVIFGARSLTSTGNVVNEEVKNDLIVPGMEGAPCHKMGGRWMGDCTVKEFTIDSYQFGFDPATITVNKGDLVVLTFTSRDVAHGVALPDFGVATQPYGPDNPGRLEFIASKTGTFTYVCNVFCGHGHGAMRGQIIVQ